MENGDCAIMCGSRYSLSELLIWTSANMQISNVVVLRCWRVKIRFSGECKTAKLSKKIFESLRATHENIQYIDIPWILDTICCGADGKCLQFEGVRWGIKKLFKQMHKNLNNSLCNMHKSIPSHLCRMTILFSGFLCRLCGFSVNRPWFRYCATCTGFLMVWQL